MPCRQNWLAVPWRPPKVYARFLHSRTPAPNRPVPINTSDVGSGTTVAMTPGDQRTCGRKCDEGHPFYADSVCQDEMMMAS